MRSTPSVISSSRLSDSIALTGYDRPYSRCGGGVTLTSSSSQSTPRPAATNVGATSHPLAMSWSVSQSATSSSRSETSIGDRLGAARRLASARAARSATASSLSTGRSLCTSRPSFSRISASISRSRALARTTAATGLFSSWVRPAVTEPRATSRSCRSIVSRVSMPWVVRPWRRWAGIGYHSLNAWPNSAAGSSSSRQSFTARAVAGYTAGTVGAAM